jgi:hypothetical protein
MTRRAAWFLIALCAWTLYVWITRVVIISGQDQSTGFKVVHDVLAVISIAFGLGAGWIGYRRLRRAPTTAPPDSPVGIPEDIRS